MSFAKAALQLIGMPVGIPRLPQVPLDAATMDVLAEDLRQAGVL